MKNVIAILYCLIMISIVEQIYARQNEKNTICGPLHFNGVVLGVTNDAQLRRLLGEGILVKKIGNPGNYSIIERYYVDRDRRATMQVVMYTDSVVGEIFISESVDDELKNINKSDNIFFDPLEGFGKWKMLHLGSTKEEVLKNLGDPVKKGDGDEWIYSSSCSCELPSYLKILFKNHIIVKITFEALPG